MGISPLTANSLPGGALAGNGWCAVEYTPGALDCEWKFRHENQLGSLIGVTNLAGNRIAEIDYGEYGQTYPKHILWDGPVDVAHTQGVAADVTRVYAQFGFGIPLDVVNGLVRCVHPGIDGHVSFGTVLAVDYDALLMQSYMDVEDLEGRVLNAIKEYGCDLTVLGNYGNVAPGIEPVTSGHWDDVTYDSLTDTTTFTDFSATFPPHAVNWWIQPDAARSTYLEIVSLGASQVVVEGDATSLAHGLTPQPGPPPLPDIIGTFYTIVWPAGVDPASGTLVHNDPCEPVSRLLFAGYYYMPPVAGTMVQPPGGGTGPHGQQPGGNHHGDYYCWNRVYAQGNGVWTTPDPAMTPVWNLQDYSRSNPNRRKDPTGNGLLGIGIGVGIGVGIGMGIVAWANIDKPSFDAAWVTKQVKLMENDISSFKLHLTSACKKGAEGCSSECCESMSAQIAQALATLIFSAKMQTRQTVFGMQGNTCRNTLAKGLSAEYKAGDTIESGTYFNCGDWTHYLFVNYSVLKATLASMSDCCECALPAGQWMLDDGIYFDHNYFRLCYGNECVNIDPWKKGCGGAKSVTASELGHSVERQ